LASSLSDLMRDVKRYATRRVWNALWCILGPASRLTNDSLQLYIFYDTAQK
jgi:hypothetical protein